MSWLAAKTFLKKAWVFTKTYWYLPALLIYTFFVVHFFRKDAGRVTEVMKSSTKRYEEEIKVIKDSHETEIKKRDEITKKYSDTLEAVERDYQEKQLDLDKKKKKKIRDLVEKYHDDHESLAKEISEKFGIEYVEREETE